MKFKYFANYTFDNKFEFEFEYALDSLEFALTGHEYAIDNLEFACHVEPENQAAKVFLWTCSIFFLLVRKDMDVNEHERLSNITFRHKVK